MTDPRELEKLLGGYATGTLTEEERQALFQASLEHQELFEALMREQPLNELLQDPAARARLLAALEERRPAWHRRWQWPLVLAPTLLGLAVGAIVLIVRAMMPAPAPPPPIVQVAPPKLALTYTILREGGAIKLRFVPNDNGHIWISDGRRLVAFSAMERFRPYTTPPLYPGSASLSVVFGREPRPGPQNVALGASEPLVLTIPLNRK